MKGTIIKISDKMIKEFTLCKIVLNYNILVQVEIKRLGKGKKANELENIFRLQLKEISKAISIVTMVFF